MSRSIEGPRLQGGVHPAGFLEASLARSLARAPEVSSPGTGDADVTAGRADAMAARASDVAEDIDGDPDWTRAAPIDAAGGAAASSASKSLCAKEYPLHSYRANGLWHI